MRHVGEVGAFGLEAGNVGECRLKVQMGGMRLVAYAVEHQHVQPQQLFACDIRNSVAVGDVGKVFEAKAKRRHVAVGQRHRCDVQAAEGELAADDVGHEARAARWPRRAKGVAEHAVQVLPRFGAGKARDCTLPVVEGAQVINPKHVVGMSVGDEDGIERLQSGAQRLLTEINRRVNENLRSLVADKQRDAQPAVAWIIRSAGWAVATNHWDAHGRTRAEEFDFHGFGKGKRWICRIGGLDGPTISQEGLKKTA